LLFPVNEFVCLYWSINMRISNPFACFAINPSKLVLAGVTAALLSGCSDSIERFSANYNNPSDSDPVYTASVPKIKKMAARPTYRKPAALNYGEEAIVQTPITTAPLRAQKAPAYDYVQNYKKPYKQPAMQQPVIAYDEQPIMRAPKAPVIKAPVYEEQAIAAPAYKAPKYKAPSFAQEEVVADNATEQAPIATPAKPAFKYKTQNAVVAQAPQPLSTKKIKPLVAEEQVAATPVAKLPKAGGTYTVATGDTLYSLGRKFNVSPFSIASLNSLDKNKTLSLGQSLRIPAGAAAHPQNVAAAAVKKPVAAEESITDDSAQADAGTIPAPTKKPAALALPKEQAASADVPAIAADAGSALAMRWPVRGKVISDFGKKPSGLKNEGINIAVPEGTAIRAAEGGVVAYAGNELKGYGNLILIRHAGGYVTAYAHAKSLNVKRGDTVKRGDVIAVAGQTGAVQSPQLHFEVRKGATALDPTKYLTSSTAMN
jgi:murein DD-endopeptidase MepM/ murein hydrolase activator NlpD